MDALHDFDQIDLTLAEGKIIAYVDVITGAELKSLPYRVAQPYLAKIYVLKEGDTFLYVGATMQSMISRIRYGLYASGKNGYHGYKWKHKEKVQLFVWIFAGLDKMQIEAIEAELVYKIRHETGKWPSSQHEIHFNNEYEKAKEYASALYLILNSSQLTDRYDIISEHLVDIFTDLPNQWGLRGDQYLWAALRNSFVHARVPNSSKDFTEQLHYHFKRLTGHPAMAGESFHVEQFAFGGMSSGMVCSDFWLEKGFPLLIKRFDQMLIRYNSQSE